MSIKAATSRKTKSKCMAEQLITTVNVYAPDTQGVKKYITEL